MDNTHYTTSRVKGKHLDLENRCELKALHKLGYSNRYIARYLNCSPTTIANELKRGTKTKASSLGRPSEYSAKRSEKLYKVNKGKCGRKPKLHSRLPFVQWVCNKVKKDKWFLDACVGYAKHNGLFNGFSVCTKTLYNSLHQGVLGLSLFDVPEVLSRRKRRTFSTIHKRILGRSIDEREESVAKGECFGHWEIDTVVNKRKGKEAVVLSMLEKHTHYYKTIQIPHRDSFSVEQAIKALKEEFGNQFSEVFKTITCDNGSEFSNISDIEHYGTKVYFAHPYSSWERGQNERHNRLLRQYLPKKCSISAYTQDDILYFADKINSIPRKSLNYQTSEELFDACLDKIYAL